MCDPLYHLPFAECICLFDTALRVAKHSSCHRSAAVLVMFYANVGLDGGFAAVEQKCSDRSRRRKSALFGTVVVISHASEGLHRGVK